MDEKPGSSKQSSIRRKSPTPQIATDNDLNILDKLDIGKLIGSGSFSNVRLAINTESKNLYALKKIQLDDLSAIQYEQIIDEVRNMLLMKHPAILKLEAALVVTTYCVMVTPLMRHRSAAEIVRKSYPTGLPEAAVGLMMKDVLSGLSYLQTKNIIHRAIKGSHILIKDTGAAILSGFRYLLHIPPKEKTITTPTNSLSEMTKYINWLSPELLMQDSSGVGLNSDIYSIGITCCELANGEVPYSEVSATGILIKKIEEPAPRLWDSNSLPSQEGQPPNAVRGILRHPRDQPYKRKTYSSNFKTFVALCLESLPESRASCEQAIKSKFINTYKDSPPNELLKQLPLLGSPLTFVPQDEPAQPSTSPKKNVEWNF